MRLCKDCRHCVPNKLRIERNPQDFDGAKCAKKMNPVDGSADGWCETERRDYGWFRTTCGPTGKYWEPRS